MNENSQSLKKRIYIDINLFFNGSVVLIQIRFLNEDFRFLFSSFCRVFFALFSFSRPNFLFRFFPLFLSYFIIFFGGPSSSISASLFPILDSLQSNGLYFCRYSRHFFQFFVLFFVGAVIVTTVIRTVFCKNVLLLERSRKKVFVWEFICPVSFFPTV